MRASWIDAHAHPERVDLDQELALLDDAGVVGFVAIGTDPPTSLEAVRIADHLVNERHDLSVGATIGIHPHDAQAHGAAIGELEALHEEHRGVVVGIGECGLDYHYDYSPRPVQRRVFAEQVSLAHRLGLVLVVHTREAWADTEAILDDAPSPPAIIIHSFSEGPEEAERALARGWYLSFSGIVTFKNASPVREALALVPIERLLVETDTPFLAPVPLRGRPNHIANVAVTGCYVANEKGVDAEELAHITAATTRRLFGLRGVEPSP